MGEKVTRKLGEKKVQSAQRTEKMVYTCDRCGHEMIEKNCKVFCPNCGNQFDCSDLNIYFD